MRKREHSQISLYTNWLSNNRDLTFGSYNELWDWSVKDLDSFWRSIWDYFSIESDVVPACALLDARMPGTKWFPNVRLNYARQVLRHADSADAAGQPAIISRNESGEERIIEWSSFRNQVASLALELRALGVRPGDRVAAYLPNIPDAMIAFLATISLGAVWSICAPDMGVSAILDRFRQIRPKVLIVCDGGIYAGKPYDRHTAIRELHENLSTVKHLIVCRNSGNPQPIPNSLDFASLLGREDADTAVYEPVWVDFNHPLWIVYSSGTTGLPKAIVHGHGGIMLTALTMMVLHNDLGPSYHSNSLGERCHWYSSTGWVLWNCQGYALLNGTTCCIFDGSASGPAGHTDWTTLWRFAAETEVTFFGAGSAIYANCMKSGVDLRACGDLSRIRTLCSTGSPLAEDVQLWGTEQFTNLSQLNHNPEQQNIWWCNISGGTDFAGGIIGGLRELPMAPGKLQCRMLGCSVEAFDDLGRPVTGEVGELVCTRPIPSMPLYFLDDQDNQRYIASYFDTFPGVWRHGDWLEVAENGVCTIYGRSDATINRHGVRIGTSEIYRVVEALPFIVDSLVVDLEFLGRKSFMPLFVVLHANKTLDQSIIDTIKMAIRTNLSPRFLPDAIVEVAQIPRTLSGKKMEIPIKKLLLGVDEAHVINKETMSNPKSIEWYVDYAHNYLLDINRSASD